ncbi:TPA: hypothetical protein N3A50_004566 [Salmonella enterica subsp. salamae serovar 30:g,m,s:e,n,x]|nr:hypothetical protein [Salmonella enterica]HCM1946226.1 hypothetical protein [Salmonella enterica subsp. salamae serovar 30:g,m,s:e,n,x]
MKFFLSVLLIFLLLSSISYGKLNECFSENKNNYFVGNEEVVRKLTEIYVEDRYGKEHAQREKPYNISDKGDFWQVSGSIDPNATGGVFLIEIDKVNGRIISFTHGK